MIPETVHTNGVISHLERLISATAASLIIYTINDVLNYYQMLRLGCLLLLYSSFEFHIRIVVSLNIYSSVVFLHLC